MRYNELSEGKWWEDDDTITLYHGTSSALIPDIKKDGLVPPPGDLEEYFEELFQHYFKQVPSEEQHFYTRDTVRHRVIEPRTGSWRTSARDENFGSVLYFHLTEGRAATYAKSYAKHGGEIAWHVWKELGGEQHEIPPRFADAHPIVITAEIPKAWVKHGFNGPFDEVADRLRKIWIEKYEDGPNQMSWEEFVDDVDTEVRVGNTVPYSMITNIKDVTVPHPSA